ncbi:cell wall hydrolase [Sporohalobacter salinus]|uniref:cell wall hydrolase n=1 Tax=Sporohalobacter salinus TaxID=1494606 RepID=UPI00195FBA01|nr:cell wall hydrolase [Sporohalobacter salinus]MBM7623467.1 N-acetylmuramoyl-L-alanine amidase [Sporohalobacter salinus]
MHLRQQIFIVCILILTLVMMAGIGLAVPKFKLYYKVQEGDALVKIAKKFGTSVDRLKKVNNLENESIKAGQELKIPQTYQLKTGKKVDYQINRALLDKVYKKGEIIDNNLQQGSIIDGEIAVKMKNASADKIDVSNLRTLKYYLKPGDTLYELAHEFNTSVRVLRKLNNLKDTDTIRRGDKIALPINNLTPKQIISKTISRKELNLLARLVSSEARGEPFIGQVAVGAVVLNRVVSNHFPDSIRRVIYQPDQFAVVSDGQINKQPTRQAYRAAKKAVNGQDPSRGALYFYNPKTAKTMWWLSTRSTIVKIGDHVFAR